MTHNNFEVSSTIIELSQSVSTSLQSIFSQLQKQCDTNAYIIESSIESLSNSFSSIQSQSLDAIENSITNGFNNLKAFSELKSPSDFIDFYLSLNTYQLNKDEPHSLIVENTGNIPVSKSTDNFIPTSDTHKIVFTSVRPTDVNNKVA